MISMVTLYWLILCPLTWGVDRRFFLGCEGEDFRFLFLGRLCWVTVTALDSYTSNRVAAMDMSTYNRVTALDKSTSNRVTALEMSTSN